VHVESSVPDRFPRSWLLTDIEDLYLSKEITIT
jgi:hypothetical protein